MCDDARRRGDGGGRGDGPAAWREQLRSWRAAVYVCVRPELRDLHPLSAPMAGGTVLRSRARDSRAPPARRSHARRAAVPHAHLGRLGRHRLHDAKPRRRRRRLQRLDRRPCRRRRPRAARFGSRQPLDRLERCEALCAAAAAAVVGGARVRPARRRHAGHRQGSAATAATSSRSISRRMGAWRCTSLRFISSREVRCTTPPAEAGSAAVSVTGVGGNCRSSLCRKATAACTLPLYP